MSPARELEPLRHFPHELSVLIGQLPPAHAGGFGRFGREGGEEGKGEGKGYPRTGLSPRQAKHSCTACTAPGWLPCGSRREGVLPVGKTSSQHPCPASQPVRHSQPVDAPLQLGYRLARVLQLQPASALTPPLVPGTPARPAVEGAIPDVDRVLDVLVQADLTPDGIAAHELAAARERRRQRRLMEQQQGGGGPPGARAGAAELGFRRAGGCSGSAVRCCRRHPVEPLLHTNPAPCLSPLQPKLKRPARLPLRCAGHLGGPPPRGGPRGGGPPYKRRAPLEGLEGAFDSESDEDEDGGEAGYGDEAGQPGLDIYRMRRKQQRT